MPDLYHACYVAGGDRPVWIQPASHTYRPRRDYYSWKIVELTKTQMDQVNNFGKYAGPQGRVVESHTPGSW